MSSSHLYFLLVAQPLHFVHKILKLQFGVQPVSPVLHLLHQQPQVIGLEEASTHKRHEASAQCYVISSGQP